MNQERYQQAQQNGQSNIKAIFHETIRDKNDLVRKLNDITLAFKSSIESKTAAEENIQKLCSGSVTKHDLKEYTKELDAAFHAEILKGTDEDIQQLVNSLTALMSKLPQNEVENRIPVANMIHSLQNVPHFASVSKGQTFGVAKKEDGKETKKEPKKRKPIKKENPDHEIKDAFINAKKMFIEFTKKYNEVISKIMEMHQSNKVDIEYLRNIRSELSDMVQKLRSVTKDMAKDPLLHNESNELINNISILDTFVRNKFDYVVAIRKDPKAYGPTGEKIDKEMLLFTKNTHKSVWTNIGILGLEIVLYKNVLEIKKLQDRISVIASTLQTDPSQDALENELITVAKRLGNKESIRKTDYDKVWIRYRNSRKIDENDEYMNNIINLCFFHQELYTYLIHAQTTKDLNSLKDYIILFKTEFNATGRYRSEMERIMEEIEEYINLVGDPSKL